MTKTVSIDGKVYEYADGDKWNVEVSKNSGSYVTRFSLETPHRAMFYYNAINVGLGHNKRLMLVRGDKKIKVTRMTS
jgi:hypothetical protein